MNQAQASDLNPRMTERPASSILELELKQGIKKNGLVIWLDSDDKYSAFVDRLSQKAERGDFPFPVLRYDGSFLELMLALEKYGNGLHPEKVLVHMPGFNTDSIADTPLYELYKAGKSYKKSLDTLIEEACVGLVRPEDGKTFREKKPSLEEADAWLLSAKLNEKDHFLIGLEAYSPEKTLLDLFSLDERWNETLKTGDHAQQFIEYLRRTVGLPATWVEFLDLGNESRLLPVDVRFVAASWLMAVEFVTDLREKPKEPELQAVLSMDQVAKTLCLKLISQFREKFPGEYPIFSGQFEDMLILDRDGHSPDALGGIDTFRFEEGIIRYAALSALRNGQWDIASKYAQDRTAENCFWLRHDKNREQTWQLIQLGASVGSELGSSATGLKGCTSLEEATNRYRDKLYLVDRSHRHFEQNFYKLHSTELEDEAALRDARDAVRENYRLWVDKIAEEFAKLCSDLGPLPSPDLRQRGIYENFVHPIIEGGERVAFFMVDAMRYEMATELVKFFETKKYHVSINARLAELPTVTEVGMNALAPVSPQGRLRAVIRNRNFEGFRCGDQFTVSSPADRVRAMESRSISGQGINLELTQVLDATASELKKILKSKNSSPLIVVRSLELDSAGEKGFHLGTFEHTLVQLREAVQRLQQSGISRFVLAADHGFLLQDKTTQLIEYKDGPKRRHVLSEQRSGMHDALEIPLSALDYDVDSEAYLVFRRDTAIWKVQDKIAPFVHGGNSLQERVVPVICLEKRSKIGASTAQYEVVATALPAEGGRERLELKVRLQKQSSGLLSFEGPKRISLALRTVSREGYPLEALPQIVDVTPPGGLDAGVLWIPPGSEAATVIFSIEGDADEKVRIQVYHPDATEKVTPTVVEGWFSMHRSRRLGKVDGDPPRSSRAPIIISQGALSQDALSQDDAGMIEQHKAASECLWSEGIEDPEFRKVFELIDSQESVNEQELQMVLKSARRVRAFSRSFDELKKLVPFEVQIATAGGMKSYVKGDRR